MNQIKPIRTDADLDAALARIEDLMDAAEGSHEEDELDVLVELVRAYEARHFPKEFPSPIAAIEFRMDQAGLKPKDLIPYIGSRGKVSEVLSGKRSITMAMARSLHQHLGIPAEVLLREPTEEYGETLTRIDPQLFPLKQMAKLGWIPNVPELKERAEEFISDLVQRAGGTKAVPVLYRKNDHRRVNAKTDQYALTAWCWQVLARANSRAQLNKYNPGVITPEFLRLVAQISAQTEGPRLAREFLERHGIALEVVPHLKKTYLDGAAFRAGDGHPVIGLTLRYDRIDNFWFTLLHELAHVGRHLDGDEYGFFVDDLDLRNGNTPQPWDTDDSPETQADQWAEEALIPKSVWETSSVREKPSVMGAINLAQELKVHPAIIAGRIRYEHRNYHLMSQLVGSGEVRYQFEAV